MSVRPRGLGRGLSALKQPTKPAAKNLPQKFMEIPLAFLHPCPSQPRRHFGEEEIEVLAHSLKTQGLLQPLLVRPRETPTGTPTGSVQHYEIVAGERRFRAAQRAGLHAVPVLVRAVSDSEAFEMALVENVQRENLSVLEEAEAYRHLLAKHTQKILAQRVGKSRAHIANTVRLLSLPEEVKVFLADKKLTSGQARPLVGHPRAVFLARKAVKLSLTARQIESLARRAPNTRTYGTKMYDKDPNILAAEKSLCETLGLSVSLRHGKNGGTLCITYKNLEQLDLVCRRLQQPEPNL